MELLDVGGRLSNYTIGVPANITVTDLPRASAVQRQLHLGTTDDQMDRLLRRRSNVTNAHYDDMTRSELPDNSYDCVVAVEVLEHVQDDDSFLWNVRRVLRPGCPFFMTTPNGESVVNVNPDHKRHYTSVQLRELMEKHLSNVHIEFAVRDSASYTRALRSWSCRHPLQTVATMISGWISTQESRRPGVRGSSQGTHQLIAWAIKPAA